MHRPSESSNPSSPSISSCPSLRPPDYLVVVCHAVQGVSRDKGSKYPRLVYHSDKLRISANHVNGCSAPIAMVMLPLNTRERRPTAHFGDEGQWRSTEPWATKTHQTGFMRLRSRRCYCGLFLHVSTSQGSDFTAQVETRSRGLSATDGVNPRWLMSTSAPKYCWGAHGAFHV